MPRGIQISNSKIRIALFDLQPSAFTVAKGFESITRRFESPCLVLHNSSFRDSNRCLWDSNPCFSLSSCSSWEIRITNGWFESMALNISSFFKRDSNRLIGDSNQSILITFESLHEGFKSLSSVWTFWNMDSNRCLRDSNRLLQICLKDSRIEGLLEGFESSC